MHKNQFWYEKQDEATKKKVAEIFDQKQILRDAINKRKAEKAHQQAEEGDPFGKTSMARKLF